MKKILATSLTGALLTLGAAQAQAFESRVTVGAIGGTTGLGADVSWRFHERLGLSARYTGGLDWDGDFDTDEAEYNGDVSLSAGALKLDYYPFAGRFFLTVGAMLPDMEANVTGRPKDNGEYEFNGNTYTADDVGALHGKLTIADGVQPYAGFGWRSSNKRGFGLFSELGIMATNVDVSLNASGPAADKDDFQRDLRREEQRLQDDAKKLEVYPVALIGISYTF
ncbi:hypothetical protein DU490_16285 [Halomonas sp. DQ26W]|uniref:hypothetical protein n=1 Tax=Halomonas sp. DQ26W TaxID=2282311 RepID=UPI000DF79772|nr:hypothetical protein [Halomonas sp. DQ26W]RDB41842.1 hypothetical protein DU490_16285 [Halomonas sp. DQ26W]